MGKKKCYSQCGPTSATSSEAEVRRSYCLLMFLFGHSSFVVCASLRSAGEVVQDGGWAVPEVRQPLYQGRRVGARQADVRAGSGEAEEFGNVKTSTGGGSKHCGARREFHVCCRLGQSCCCCCCCYLFKALLLSITVIVGAVCASRLPKIHCMQENGVPKHRFLV